MTVVRESEECSHASRDIIKAESSWYTIVACYVNCDGVEASGMCRILIISAGSTVVPNLWFNCEIAPAMGFLCMRSKNI
jgi:hypothetical protein